MGARAKVSARWFGGSWAPRPVYLFPVAAPIEWLPLAAFRREWRQEFDAFVSGVLGVPLDAGKLTCSWTCASGVIVLTFPRLRGGGSHR